MSKVKVKVDTLFIVMTSIPQMSQPMNVRTKILRGFVPNVDSSVMCVKLPEA